MYVQTKITFVADDGEKFFGEGPYRLLRGVEKTGSLHQAAQQMEMSYSKAIKILKRAEEIIGCPLTDRATGGVSGGGSQLTKAGREWMKRYEAYRNACVEANRRLYLDFFPEQRQEASLSDGQQRQR